MDKMKLMPFLFIHLYTIYPSPQKYCNPIMFAHFFCTLLGFCAREFPTNTGKTWTFIVDQRSYVSTENPSAINSLCKFTETWDVKHKTSVCGFGRAKSQRKAIKRYNLFCSNTSNHRGYTKINQKVRESIYHWILHHPKVVLSPISNDCIYVSIYGKSEKN